MIDLGGSRKELRPRDRGCFLPTGSPARTKRAALQDELPGCKGRPVELAAVKHIFVPWSMPESPQS